MNKIFPPRARQQRPFSDKTQTAVLNAPPGVRFIPGERVLLLSVALPRMSASQRRSAVRFAIEDQITQPLEEVNVAIGPETEPDQWLVAIIAHADLPREVPHGQRILPDMLGVPVPPPGRWAVVEDAGRILIRMPNGAGLVATEPTLLALHRAAGAPDITLYAGQIGLAHDSAPLPPVTLPPKFDLTDRQNRPLTLPPTARRLFAIAAVAAIAHLAILAADVVTLSRTQTALSAQLRDAAGTTVDADIDALLTRILSPKTAESEAGFLHLLSTGFAALTAEPGSISLRELSYGADSNSLILTLIAPDLGSLQQAESDLAAANLRISAGPAISANGTAEQQLTLQGGGS